MKLTITIPIPSFPTRPRYVAFGVVATVAASLAMTAVIDPAILAIGAPSSLSNAVGTGTVGTTPTTLTNGGFALTDTGATAIPSPIEVYFLEAQGNTAPQISSVTDSNNAAVGFTAPSLMATTVGPNQDLYGQLGCLICNHSISFGNMAGVLAARNQPVPSAFAVYQATLNNTLSPAASDQVTGMFGDNTFIAPLAGSGNATYDTTFGNTGLIEPASAAGNALIINNTVVIAGGAGFLATAPASDPIPEPSTAALLVSAVLVIPWIVWYRQRRRST